MPADEATSTPLARRIARFNGIAVSITDMLVRAMAMAMAMAMPASHRGMRLSNGGTLIGDNIQCNYHGIQFAPNGRACLIPSGGTAASALSVYRYLLQEVSGWIWAWAGDPQRADPALIPDHTELGLTAPGLFDLLAPDRVPEVSVRSYEGAIRTRRLIARQIADERQFTRARLATTQAAE